jgi:hypothetical protein
MCCEAWWGDMHVLSPPAAAAGGCGYYATACCTVTRSRPGWRGGGVYNQSRQTSRQAGVNQASVLTRWCVDMLTCW